MQWEFNAKAQRSQDAKVQDWLESKHLILRTPEAQLPDGAEVEVTSLEARPDDPPFLRAILKLAKPRDWPGDFALNHAHYAKGHPKKS